MNLNFENDSDLIISLAEKAARLYVGITKNANDYEDAKCDAYLIATEIDFDETRTKGERDAYIIKRIVGKLIDVYRKHNNKRADEVELSELREEQTCVNDEPGIDNLGELIKAFEQIANLGVCINRERTRLTQTERDVILDYLRTKTRADAPRSPLLQVAQRHGITQGRASQIMGLFKRRARFAVELGTPRVYIIEVGQTNPTPRDLKENPLFYWRTL